ncbi:cobalt-precorrin 5A hydrolase [Moorella naiadis]|uniref:cobalt-precorrin 5A hydrolase n=1 Tax=Moorella naiadis (nom. illeg.) TaxID=3093670 RepID=UPI003D9CB68B
MARGKGAADYRYGSEGSQPRITMPGGEGLAVVALTWPGLQTARRLVGSLPPGTELFAPASLAPTAGPETGAVKSNQLYDAGRLATGDANSVRFYQGRLGDLLGEIFHLYRGLILIMATGIAVRSLRDYIVSKKTDPAVVVVDASGRYAISLLSGHLGGANELARQVAAILGAEAVITTASETRGLPALDLVAGRLGLGVWPRNNLTAVMAALVNGEEVEVLVEPSLLALLQVELPELAIRPLGDQAGVWGDRAGILVTWRRLPLPGPRWVFWRPQVLAAGVGCRRGTPASVILYALGMALQQAGLSRRSLQVLASVDFKGREPGLQLAARRLGLELRTFTPEELAACLERHPELSSSAVVAARVGLAGVCEPAALLAGGEGELLWPKMKYRGVTIALSLAPVVS